MTLEQINNIVNGRLTSNFNYSVDNNRRFNEIVTYEEPSIEVLRELVHNGFACTICVELYDVEKTRKMYCINHESINDYEWCD